MKTDLAKILSIGGQPGLYRYLVQSNGGVVVESLIDGKRKWMGPSARMTSLSDISVYTQTNEELRLQDVLTRMKEFLKQDQAPAPGSDTAAMAAFFEKVIPEYDRDRFYPSHMKKVLDWYNLLKSANALDFEPSAEEAVEDAAASPEEETRPGTKVSSKPVAKTPKPAAKVTKPVAARSPKTVVKHTTQK
ncbi:MAG TPA: DUF5606 domain-containing protein [Bacteroidales bacterium]|nr:DUF5606 domain-containing protein [Bacteroidales bacterium]HQB56420.1 DUF5606 domain-containing protein [Bacteroidales bacterium]